LHTDSRPEHTYEWTNPDGQTVLRNDKARGFTVLYNEGSPLGPERQRLARDIAIAMAVRGMHPYTAGYGHLYDADGVAGVYIDRRGLKMLRAPEVPSVIIETHHALDYNESLSWREQHTHDVFAAAVADGLVQYFDGAGAGAH
jgi:N-acetylmuramoyl-L-alanine amidase